MLTPHLKEMLQPQLQSAINMSITSWEIHAVGGGSVNETLQFIINKKEKYFCKINAVTPFPDLFEKEINGLKTLQHQDIFTIPNVILYQVMNDCQFLIMEWIEPSQPDESFWEIFGEKLAVLHSISAEKFGLEHDNYMGTLPQSNHFQSSWIDFFAYQRIQPQIELAFNKGLILLNDLHYFESLYKKLPAIFSEEPPSLLHGDLWAGNFICDSRQQPVLIDPAIYYGHRAIDLGMSTLFGGFANKFYNAYRHQSYLATNYEVQWEVCNLYPLLIHLNLFGRAYLPQVIKMVKKYC